MCPGLASKDGQARKLLPILLIVCCAVGLSFVSIVFEF